MRSWPGPTAFRPVIGMLEDKAALERAAEIGKPDVIIHLAAQAGVRYSLENPKAYVDSNLIGSWNILELAKAINRSICCWPPPPRSTAPMRRYRLAKPTGPTNR